MALTVFNPVKQALKNLNGLDRIDAGRSRNWNTTAFCWTCSKDKPAKGGKRQGHRDAGPGFSAGSRIRFTCLDCMEVRAEKKVAAETALIGQV